MNRIKLVTRNIEETQVLGELMGKSARKGDIILLHGDLGAGKTTITQAIARGIEVPASYYVTSPTFSIIHEYPGRIPLYHMDLYRLSDEGEVIDLGLDEYLFKDGLSVVEWPERALALFPEHSVDLIITNIDENEREIIFQISQKELFQRFDHIANDFEELKQR